MKPSGSHQKNPLSNARRSATEPDRTEETLRFQKALLEAQSEASIDGILVVSTEGKMISFNRRFIEMWGMPEEVIASRSDETALQWALDKLVDPQEFLARVAYLYEHAGEESRDEIVLKDGRTFDRYSAPVKDKDGTHYGRVWYFRDVTEHKRADEALRHSEERFRSLVQYASDIITVLGADGTVRYESPSMERIMGYDPQELVGTNAFDRIHPEDVERVWGVFAEALQKQGVSPPVEFRLRHADGSWRYLEAIGYNRLDDPSVRGMVVNSRDITERKQAEEALREGEERLRFALEAGGMGAWEWDIGSGRVVWSPTLEAIHGRAPGSFGGTFEEVLAEVHPDDRDLLISSVRDAVEGRSGHDIEYRIVWPDGSVHWLEAKGRVVRDENGEPLRMVGVCTDITGRKEAERERAQLLLREQAAHLEAETAKERLKGILDNLGEGVLVADLEGRVVFANPAACTMLGMRSDEPLEELPDLWEDFHLPKAVAHCARGKESIEARVRSGESYLWIKLECLANNERDDVLVVMQDLSEGHRLEANQQRFLANAAHQLRTPTMAVMGAAELLATGEDADPAIRRRLLNYIFSEGRRMQRLSDALLRLARVGWDLRDPDLGVVDLRAAGQHAAEMMEPLAESAGLRISIEGEGACVRADPEWLQEVLLVLLSNAIKYSSRGGDIRLRVAGNTLTVEDEGAGISPADLPHVFERFYRGKANSEGFGLGLPICRELTERMGGSISIRSREGVGTAVRIELPEVEADA